MRNFFPNPFLLLIGICILVIAYLMFYIESSDSIQKILFIIGGVLFTLLGLYVIFEKLIMRFTEQLGEKPCKICHKKSSEKLIGDKLLGNYCREHLISEFSRFFLSSPFDVLAVELQPQVAETTGEIYYFRPLQKTEDFGGRGKMWPESDKEIIRNLLESIQQRKCKICDQKAQILFVPKELAPFKKYDSPSLDFIKFGEYFCKEDGLKRILPSLESNPKKFRFGLYIPFISSGLYMTDEV